MNSTRNPLNIKQPSEGQHWQGAELTNDAGTEIFASEIWAIRAAFISLTRKWHNNKTTIQAIVNDWAPADDTQGSIAGNPPNDPVDYANYVAKAVGCSPLQALSSPEDTPHLWAVIIRAMSIFETSEPCDWDIIFGGISKALIYLRNAS